MRYRVAHRRAATQSGLTQVLGLMRIISATVGLLLIPVLCSARAATTDDCAAMLVDAPGSSEARVCLTKESESLQKKMDSIQALIENEIRLGHASFTLQQFQSAQNDWREFVKSTCWLDAAGAANSDAISKIFMSGYARQRLGQLKTLSQSLSGDEPAQWPMSMIESAGNEP